VVGVRQLLVLVFALLITIDVEVLRETQDVRQNLDRNVVVVDLSKVGDLRLVGD
jgi:hypothetical protein